MNKIEQFEIKLQQFEEVDEEYINILLKFKLYLEEIIFFSKNKNTFYYTSVVNIYLNYKELFDYYSCKFFNL